MSTINRQEEVLRRLARQTPTRILYLILDGVGDLEGVGGRTPLEAAATPHLDELAQESTHGLLDPVLPGVTPGSGPGHLALFGYDPLQWEIGRGLLSALGIGFPMQPGDVACRLNFCTLDEAGRVQDRRAGRIPTSENERLVARLEQALSLDGVEIFLRTVSEHRALLVLRGEGLGAELSDTDPQLTGVPPLAPEGRDAASARTAKLMATLLEQARSALADEPAANGILARGFEGWLELPGLKERFHLRPVAIAKYPMYRGLARLAGMSVAPVPQDLPGYLPVLEDVYEEHDFFFVHVKETDKAGEDGDFSQKVAVIEAVDALMPALLKQGFDVIGITGDHSTPCSMAAHSWHPVPALLWGQRVRQDRLSGFNERLCARGGMGRLPMRLFLPVMLGTAGKLAKYGA